MPVDDLRAGLPLVPQIDVELFPILRALGCTLSGGEAPRLLLFVEEKPVDKLFILFQRPFDQTSHVAERIVGDQIAQAQGLVDNQPAALVFDAGAQVRLDGLQGSLRGDVVHPRHDQQGGRRNENQSHDHRPNQFRAQALLHRRSLHDVATEWPRSLTPHPGPLSRGALRTFGWGRQRQVFLKHLANVSKRKGETPMAVRGQRRRDPRSRRLVRWTNREGEGQSAGRL